MSWNTSTRGPVCVHQTTFSSHLCLHRYIAKELLSNQSIYDLSKCDILSLGLTGSSLHTSLLRSDHIPYHTSLSSVVYGLCTDCLLEPGGDQWFQLRNGIFLFPEATEPDLIDLITTLCASNPEARPSASHCIHTYTILMTSQEIQLKEQLDKIRELERRLKMFTVGQPQQEQEQEVGRALKM
jgi:serine/threonine protein kinase